LTIQHQQMELQQKQKQFDFAVEKLSI
jgi:hypothetical protein